MVLPPRPRRLRVWETSRVLVTGGGRKIPAQLSCATRAREQREVGRLVPCLGERKKACQDVPPIATTPGCVRFASDARAGPAAELAPPRARGRHPGGRPALTTQTGSRGRTCGVPGPPGAYPGSGGALGDVRSLLRDHGRVDRF